MKTMVFSVPNAWFWTKRFASGPWRRGVALIAIACAVACGPICKAEPIATPPQWASRAWELNDLIPGEGAGGSVRGVVQADDGSLVIATTVGLVRFDGNAFRRIPLGLPAGEQPQVLHVARRPSGPIAAVLASGLLLWLDDRDSIQSVAPPPEEAGAPSTSLAIDARGKAWVANERGGVWTIGRDGSRRVIAAGTVAPTGRAHLTGTADGTVWVCRNQSLSIAHDDALETVGQVPRGLSVVAAATGGGAWLTTQGQLFRHDRDGTSRQVVPDSAAFQTPPVEDVIGTVRSLFEAPDGRLWLCSSRYGLFALEDGVLTQIDIGETWVTNAIQDREGSIWVGTRLAIHRVRPAIAWPTSLPTWRPIVSLCRDGRGQTWCLTQNGEIGSWPDDDLAAFRMVPEADRGRAVCLASDGAGSVWAAMERGELRCFRGEHVASERPPPPHDRTAATALLALPTGDLWVLAGDTVLRKRDREWQAVTGWTVPAMSSDSPPSNGQPAAPGANGHFAAAPNGDVWLVTDKGVACIAADSGVLTHLATPPLGGGRLGPIVQAHDGCLWVAIKTVGLARWKDSRWTTVTPAQGLPSDEIVGAVCDATGRLWAASPRMLFVVDLAELGHVADGVADRCHCWVLPPRYETDFLEGLATPTCAMLSTTGGTLLVARQSGLVVCDPARLPTPTAPAVVVHSVSSDQTSRLISGSGHGQATTVASLPPAPRRVEIDFGVASLLAPTNARVEYRLEGIDDTWMSAALHGRATYPALPAGTYAFRLRSSTHDAGWAPRAAAVTVAVATPLWETWWFRLIALTTVSGLAAAAAMAVVGHLGRRRMALLRQQAAVHDERMRLARDMHDEVGTNLTQIALLAEIAKDDARQEQAEQLDTVARISRETVTALDELVWAVDPGNDTLPHLLSYACRYASETLREFGVTCDVERPVDLYAVPTPGDMRRGVLLIVKEAITNVISHARASRVVLRMAVDDGRLRITIADDGGGLAFGGRAGGGAGLGNMRHRAAELGGRCDVTSDPNGGTIVRLELPLTDPIAASSRTNT